MKAESYKAIGNNKIINKQKSRPNHTWRREDEKKIQMEVIHYDVSSQE